MLKEYTVSQVSPKIVIFLCTLIWQLNKTYGGNVFLYVPVWQKGFGYLEECLGVFSLLAGGKWWNQSRQMQNPLGNPILIDIYNDRNNKSQSIFPVEMDQWNILHCNCKLIILPNIKTFHLKCYTKKTFKGNMEECNSLPIYFCPK